MKRKLIISAVFGGVMIGLWCLLPFKVGEFDYSTPMSPKNLILVRAGSEEPVAHHLRGVTDYVSKMGAHLKLESFSRLDQLPFSRFLPFPQKSAAPYDVRVTFSNEQGERFTAIFPGKFESHGFASPRYISQIVKESLDTSISTVFGQSPGMIQGLLKP